MGLVMKTLADICEKKRGNPSRGLGGHAVTGVSRPRLARWPLSSTTEPVQPWTRQTTSRVLNLPGVSRVQVDSLRSTIHVVYDGTRETVRRVHRLLAATA
jgi:hypothetical protein